jgi:adenine-specific DNA-methyltransferase
MTDISQFRAVAAWRAALGLLPVPLRDTAENNERYVLLNGTNGNFCLDFMGGIDPTAQRATAWSCDVGHYVTCAGDSVLVNRWERDGAEERYSSRSVIEQLHQFHRHLEKTTPDRSRSIVTHVLGVFRRIRTVFPQENNGFLSLRVLLHLMASAAAGCGSLLEGNELELWGLNAEIAAASDSVAPATWQPLYNDLSGIGRYDVFRPDFSLVLRHASGAVFQDAHLEVNNSPTFWLPGFELPARVDRNAVPTETGVYFTPPALARTLAEEATINIQPQTTRPLVLFDPACGSGELLKECLRLLKIKQYGNQVRVIGWDKSTAAVDMARFVLSWEKRSWLPGQVELEIVQQDSVTAQTWPGGVDVLVMNPPFKSWQLMSPEEQESVRNILGASGKPNLAIAFAHRAVTALSEGGILAMIAPTSLLEGGNGAATRQIMSDVLNPQLVARLGDQTIFARALVDAGMYVGRMKPATAAPTGVLWADSRLNSLNRALRGLRRWRGAEIEPITEDGFSVYLRKDVAISGDPWIARRHDAWFRYKQFEHNKKLKPAKSLFAINQGIRLGNDVFVVPKEYVQGLRRKSEQQFFRPAIMNPSIADGKLSDAYYAFYPYTSGLPTIKTERELEEHVPGYYKDHLLPAKQMLKGRKTLVRQTELKWWDLLWPRSWQKNRGSKIVSKYFGGERSFGFDKTGDFVVVVGNGWLLKKGAIGELSQEIPEITDEEAYLGMLAYLNSSLAHDLLEYLSIQVSGGQLDLSNRYVSELPVPDFTKLNSGELGRLTIAGGIIAEGKVERWSDVDDLVLSIFE